MECFSGCHVEINKRWENASHHFCPIMLKLTSVALNFHRSILCWWSSAGGSCNFSFWECVVDFQKSFNISTILTMIWRKVLCIFCEYCLALLEIFTAFHLFFQKIICRIIQRSKNFPYMYYNLCFITFASTFTSNSSTS